MATNKSRPVRSQQIGVRVAPDEMEALQAVADEQRMPLALYVRRAALAQAEKDVAANQRTAQQAA